MLIMMIKMKTTKSVVTMLTTMLTSITTTMTIRIKHVYIYIYRVDA